MIEIIGVLTGMSLVLYFAVIKPLAMGGIAAGGG